MTALDIIALLLMGGAGILGLQRGFVTESLSLIAWVAALVAVRIFHAPVRAILEGTVGTWGGATRAVDDLPSEVKNVSMVLL